MKVLAASLPKRPAAAERVPFAELLPQVDFLSLHCPLTADTQDLVDAAAFAKMKPSAFLINCARGGVVAWAAFAFWLHAAWIGVAPLGRTL